MVMKLLSVKLLPFALLVAPKVSSFSLLFSLSLSEDPISDI